jgi:hypothetical protein
MRKKIKFHSSKAQKKQCLLLIAINQRHHHALRIEHQLCQVSNAIKICVWTRIPDIKSVGEMMSERKVNKPK